MVIAAMEYRSVIMHKSLRFLQSHEMVLQLKARKKTLNSDRAVTPKDIILLISLSWPCYS